MKKFKKPLIAVLSITVAAASLFALAACNPELTDEPLNATKIADYTLTAEDRTETFASGSKGFSWENGSPFNVWWKPQNVSYEDGKLSLSLSEMTEKEQVWDEETEKLVDCNAQYYGAEERSEHYYGYGDYQVRMKPAKVVGTASTFFTCTGDYDKWYSEDGTEVIKENKHDEVDIEFLGKDTTRVQFNYFADDKGGHEYMYDLGFDASEDFHDYGYRWTKSYITWFVDGKPVYRVDRKKNEPWPETPGRILMNYWCGTEDVLDWIGTFDDDYTGRAEYEYVATSATQCPDPNTAHIKEDPNPNPPDTSDVPTEGWTDIDYSGVGGWCGYTVSTTDGLTISHNEKKVLWNCEGTTLTACYDWVKFTLKNNDKINDAVLRISIKDTALGDNAPAAIAGVISEGDTTYDTGAGVAIINLKADEEIEVVLKMKAEYADQLTIFLNSTDGAVATSGSITITDLQGIVNADIEKPEPAEDKLVKIGENEVAFAGAGYTVTVSDDQSSMTVDYKDIGGNKYNFISTDISEFVGNNNVFTVTIKNAGAATVKIRLDIVCATENGSAKTEGGENPDGKNDFCNISPEYNGTVAGSGNDYDWGGADWVQIASDETVTVKIIFTEGVATGVRYFIDSSTYDDTDKHTGSVVFSNMSLSKATAANDGEENAD